MPTVDQIRHRITRPTAMTSTADGRDHLLSQQATTAGLVAGHGRYTALCGRLVIAASLMTPPGRRAWTARQHCTAAPRSAPPRTATKGCWRGCCTDASRAPARGPRPRQATGRCERDALVCRVLRRRRHAPRRARATRSPGDRALRRQAVPPLTVLPGVLPDQAQVCPTCRSDQPVVPPRGAESMRWPRSRPAPLATLR